MHFWAYVLNIAARLFRVRERAAKSISERAMCESTWRTAKSARCRGDSSSGDESGKKAKRHGAEFLELVEGQRKAARHIEDGYTPGGGCRFQSCQNLVYYGRKSGVPG